MRSAVPAGFSRVAPKVGVCGRMASRTPSGHEICSPDIFDYYDISNVVSQRLRGLHATFHIVRSSLVVAVS